MKSRSDQLEFIFSFVDRPDADFSAEYSVQMANFKIPPRYSPVVLKGGYFDHNSRRSS